MTHHGVDRAYANLISHLQSPSARLPAQTVLSAIPYYLSTLPLPHPTQLTAFVISSSLWLPLSVDGLWSLTNAFRSAVHLKKGNIDKEPSGWFSKRPETLLVQWIRGVMKGVSRGNSHIRIATLGGILLGLEDFKHETSQDGIRDRVESQVVIACAEVLEALSTAEDAWNSEFTARGRNGQADMNGSIFIYLACHILPLVSSNKFCALDLSALIHLTLSAVKFSFSNGAFLNNLAAATIQESNRHTSISLESSFQESLRNVSNGRLYQAAGPLSRLLSRALSQLTEDKPSEAWHAFNDTSQDLELMACKVETDWKLSILSGITSEEDIDSQSRKSSTEMWSILKTLLFSLVLVSQSILSEVPYIHPLPAEGSARRPSPTLIACSVLRSLGHLSFVLSRFGGVAPSGESFKELKRVFYMALDIVSADPTPETVNLFVDSLLLTQEPKMDLRHPFKQAKIAYLLAVIEQLVPVLGDSIIETCIVPFCQPYLDNPLNRETYESAHSVVLSIFSNNAQSAEGQATNGGATLAERLVPFYVNSLIENSSEGRLSRTQLKLAYSNLVRSAASRGDDAIVWLCVEALLSRIESFRPHHSRLIDLYLTLVSLISCVPLSLLLRELEEVEKVLESVDGEDVKLLADAVLEEITNRVGDRERGVAVSWWCGIAPKFSTREEAGDFR